jgi:hypothetical protein
MPAVGTTIVPYWPLSPARLEHSAPNVAARIPERAPVNALCTMPHRLADFPGHVFLSLGCRAARHPHTMPPQGSVCPLLRFHFFNVPRLCPVVVQGNVRALVRNQVKLFARFAFGRFDAPFTYPGAATQAFANYVLTHACVGFDCLRNCQVLFCIHGFCPFFAQAFPAWWVCLVVSRRERPAWGHWPLVFCLFGQLR